MNICMHMCKRTINDSIVICHGLSQLRRTSGISGEHSYNGYSLKKCVRGVWLERA